MSGYRMIASFGWTAFYDSRPFLQYLGASLPAANQIGEYRCKWILEKVFPFND
jgi:hypothetical protein